MAIKTRSGTNEAPIYQTLIPGPPPLQKSLQALPKDILETSLVPALRQTEVMPFFALADRVVHQAGMRVAVSEHLRNIRLGVELLGPLVPVGSAEISEDHLVGLLGLA